MSARVSYWDGVESAYAAAQAWVDLGLRKDDSLFTQENPSGPGNSWGSCTAGSWTGRTTVVDLSWTSWRTSCPGAPRKCTN